MIGVSILGWNVWKGVLLFLCVSLCIAGFSAFFSGDTRSLLPSVMFLALTLFMLRKPLASLFLRLKWKFPRPSPTRPLAVKSQKVKQSKTFPAPSEEPSHIQVYTKKIDPEENLSLTGAKLTYSDAEALRYWNGKPTSFEIPAYYSESAFGRNAGTALRRLLAGGFLTTGDIRKSIQQKTVPELKSVLTARGLKVSGKKDELVQRLMDNLPSAELHELFPVGVYEITPAGEQALDEYSIIFEEDAHQLGLSHYRLLKEKESNPSTSDTDILLRVLKQDLSNAQKAGEQETYRVKAMEIARFLNELGRPEEAIEYYCLSFFMFWHRNTFELQANNVYAYEYDAKKIDRCGQMCGYSLTETLEIFQHTIRNNNPFTYGTNRNVIAAQKAFQSALSI